MSDKFTITWRDGAYYVSIPNYQGGEVVRAEDYSRLERERDGFKNWKVEHERILDVSNQLFRACRGTIAHLLDDPETGQEGICRNMLRLAEERDRLRAEVERAETKAAAEYEAHRMTQCERDQLRAEVEVLKSKQQTDFEAREDEFRTMNLALEAMRKDRDQLRAEMDFLERHVVEVRTPLMYGSRALFFAQEVSDEGEGYRNDLRKQIAAALAEKR